MTPSEGIERLIRPDLITFGGYLHNDTKNQIELLNLRQELENAVQTEDYEQAAKLRDKIKKNE